MLKFQIRRVIRSIWFRPAAFAFVAIAATLFAPAIGAFVPEDWVGAVNTEAVETTLQILASSMLAVAIFALATMFSAFQAAADAATPRARPLVTEDRTAQTAISTFIGAFLFSLLSLTALTTDLYGDGDILILFVLTMGLVLIVVITLLSWIRRLRGFGGVEEAILAIEAATAQALCKDARHPAFGAVPAARAPADFSPVEAAEPAYVQSVDTAQLARIAGDAGGRIHIAARPGRFVGPGRPLAFADAAAADCADDIRAAFAVASARTFQEDPRFGMVALSEIASRALSPAVNDPGTAISVMAAQTRLFSGFARARAKAGRVEPDFPDISAPELSLRDLFEDAFAAIARDGAGHLEVGVRMRKMLAMLVAADPDLLGAEARRTAALALDAASRALKADGDLETLQAAGADALGSGGGES